MTMWFRLPGGLMQQVVERTDGTWVGDEDDTEPNERASPSARSSHYITDVSANYGQQTRGRATKFYAIPTLNLGIVQWWMESCPDCVLTFVSILSQRGFTPTTASPGVQGCIETPDFRVRFNYRKVS